MSEQLPEGYKVGKCDWCEDEGNVFEDNGLCDGCDSDVVYCTICECQVHVDNTCRHVFRDSDFEWTGSGAYEPSDGVKASFFKLLDLMPDSFAHDLQAAIESERFHTWFIAPLIGDGVVLELYGMPRPDGKPVRRSWGDALIEIGEGESGEVTAEGYSWIASLYNDRTPDANSRTVAWLDEWIAS
jgi:hypothetical protein